MQYFLPSGSYVVQDIMLYPGCSCQQLFERHMDKVIHFVWISQSGLKAQAYREASVSANSFCLFYQVSCIQTSCFSKQQIMYLQMNVSSRQRGSQGPVTVCLSLRVPVMLGLCGFERDAIVGSMHVGSCYLAGSFSRCSA